MDKKEFVESLQEIFENNMLRPSVEPMYIAETEVFMERNTNIAIRSGKRIVLVHDNDPDGFASANILKHRCSMFGEHIELVPVTHGKPFGDFVVGLEESRKSGGWLANVGFFIVMDHAVPKAYADCFTVAVEEKESSLLVIDHHADTPSFSRDPRQHFFKDMHRSTTMLAYILHVGSSDNYSTAAASFNLDSVSALAHLVDFYDTWQFSRTSSPVAESYAKALCGYAFHAGFDNVPWRALSSLVGMDALIETVKEGQKLLEIKDQVANKVANKSLAKRLLYVFDSDNKLTPVIIGMVFHSDDIDNVSAKVLELNKDIDVVAVVYLKADPDASFKIAMRSRVGGVNVGLIAKNLGGGGHQPAAGVQLADLNTFMQLTHGIED